jgi:hypothetical protein
VRPGVWFCGDFESGGLDGWTGDLARSDSALVVRRPVRKGRYAVQITLRPGDRAAQKERAELKVGDGAVERAHGHQGGEMWYGWSLLVPADNVDPPPEALQIVAQWHHRSPETVAGERPWVSGPPPLTLHLMAQGGRPSLVLFGRATPQAERRTLGESPIRRGEWFDLVFHIRWSTGRDGYVEGWLGGRPFTKGRIYGPNLYFAGSNYLRLGLYHGKGAPTTNRVYLDEVRIGDSYRAVAP